MATCGAWGLDEGRAGTAAYLSASVDARAESEDVFEALVIWMRGDLTAWQNMALYPRNGRVAPALLAVAFLNRYERRSGAPEGWATAHSSRAALSLRRPFLQSDLRSNYDHSGMNEQRSPWAQPRMIAMLGVIAGINVVLDWFVFRPKNWPFFIVVEIVVMGGIIALVRCWRSRP